VRLRTYIAVISALLVLVIIVVISVQTRRILDRGFGDIATTELVRAKEIIQAVIKSKRENLTRFKKLIVSDEEISKALNKGRLVPKLAELKDIGQFDFVDFIYPDGTSAFGNEKKFGNGARIEETLDADKFSVVRMQQGLVLVAFCTKKQKEMGTLVLGYSLSGFFEQRLSELTGSNVTFVTRETLVDMKEVQPTPGPRSTELVVARFPGRTLIAEISLDWGIFDAIDLRLRKNLLYAGSISLLILLALLYLLFELGFVRRLEKIINGIRQATNKMEEGAVPNVEFKNHPISELKWLSRAFSQFSSSIKNYDEKAKQQAVASAQMEKQAALASLAQQVAHDIRSPLAALEMFVDTYDEMPAEPRSMMKGCVARALDVANTLLDKFKAETSSLAIDDSASNEVPREIYLISTLVEAIVSEKRIQYGKREGIVIRTDFNAASYGLFVLLSALRFKRILSNIIDNAVEAIDEKGEVVIRLSPVGHDNVSIVVEDNGRGIDAELLPKLGTRGTTFGKSSGTGLGLHYAKTVVESVGGTFNIYSTPSVGTKVEGILKRAETPDWFVEKLVLPQGSHVGILDDDPSIHHLWEERLKSLKANFSLHHFRSVEEMQRWYNNGRPNLEKCLFLCDFELLGQTKNGLDAIEQLAIQKQSVLVTTHFEDEEVRKRCAQLGVRIIPKVLARFVPIKSE
jgi:signal transduction histidine kinase